MTLETPLKEKRISFATISLLGEDFLRVEVHAGATVDIPQLEELSAAYEELLGSEKKFYLLTILPFDMHHDADVRRHWSRPERSERKMAEALVVNGLGLVMVANFVTRVQKPRHQISCFHTEEKAMEWLQQLRKK